MKIKKLLKICFIAMGLSLSSISLAENYNLTNVANTCAPWDSHAVSFYFQSDTNKDSYIRIALWNLNPPKKTMILNNRNSQKSNGNLSICSKGVSGMSCEQFDGIMKLNEPINFVKAGDNIEGSLEINTKEKTILKFKHTVKEQVRQLCG